MIPLCEQKKIKVFSGNCNDIMQTSLLFAVKATNAPLEYRYYNHKTCV